MMVSKTARAEMLPDLGVHLGREVGPRVVHREHNALDREIGVEVVPDEVDRGDELRQPFQRVVLALDGDDDGVGGGERVHGQQAQRGRAVEHDVVVGSREVGQDASQPALALGQRRQFDLGSGE